MDSFLDDSYGVCSVPPDGGRWTVTFLLVSLLALILIRRTVLDLEQTRKDYLEDVD
jgi:hypothetical protein